MALSYDQPVKVDIMYNSDSDSNNQYEIIKYEDQMANPRCPICNEPMPLQTVKRSTSNQGRKFYACSCVDDNGYKQFFWADLPRCKCGGFVKSNTVKKNTKNKGRTFKMCTHCKRFCWVWF